MADVTAGARVRYRFDGSVGTVVRIDRPEAALVRWDGHDVDSIVGTVDLVTVVLCPACGATSWRRIEVSMAKAEDSLDTVKLEAREVEDYHGDDSIVAWLCADCGATCPDELRESLGEAFTSAAWPGMAHRGAEAK